jgi:hypothetical protein
VENFEASDIPDRLLGMAEIAELAGSSRQAITNLRARDEGFPAPLAELRSGPVFREADVRAYLASRGRMTPSAEPDVVQVHRPERFDPLTPLNLARSVERALLDEPLDSLPPIGSFGGGGVYCIYYSGPYEPYGEIAGEPPQIPIYVGSATIQGRGVSDLLTPTNQPLLFNRLRDHARTLQQAENLRLDDFSCRFLLADDIWAPRAAPLLVQRFRPLWNVVVEGFGLHEPGAARYSQPRSPWDELHPGRSWAARLRPSRRTLAEIMQAVADHLSEYQSPDPNSVTRVAHKPGCSPQ